MDDYYVSRVALTGAVQTAMRALQTAKAFDPAEAGADMAVYMVLGSLEGSLTGLLRALGEDL